MNAVEIEEAVSTLASAVPNHVTVAPPNKQGR